MHWLTDKSDGCDIAVKVTPKASRNEIAGERDGRLALKVTAAPESGRANNAVIKLLAKKLGVAPSRISVAAGTTARQKRIHVAGLSAKEARSELAS